MKKYLLTGLVIAPLSVQALELTDYKEVDSRYENAYINGQFSANDGNQDQASFNLGLSGDYNRNISTQQEVKDFKLKANALSSRGSNAEDSTIKSYDIDTSSSYSSYFSEDPNST